MTPDDPLQTVRGQPSWTISSRQVDVAVSRLGGQMAPLVFHLEGGPVEPLSIPHWAEDPTLAQDQPPVVQALRGDMFCLPFGVDDPGDDGETGPVHGEPANGPWVPLRVESPSHGDAELRLRFALQRRPGVLYKRVRLRDGHHAVYLQHVAAGLAGPMCFGHHCALRFPDQEGAGLVATSPFRVGKVFPDPLEDPAAGGYSSLLPGTEFTDLASVPTANGEAADLSHYPARRGYEDLVQLMSEPGHELAWNAVTFAGQRYVWFALRDPRVLTGTVMWMSNGGRHYAPWSGRHVNVLGVEDLTTYFFFGPRRSAEPNAFSERGLVTAVRLQPEDKLVVNYIIGVASCPPPSAG